ncbi:LOW QUALITY PROTEIN: hypothetical protein BC936DRAFT_146379 [Jimgerdemannia flammicorona]|uniref:Uncharacterized protein n=1 Tax=Jimgerdemannia flammicorona TaxID=994334 RepID=A0A433D8I1_9FUNG|nr:LOW QUALITY PROTEIN: hypothetical protein BC936DRAFT_146379 [Jimgerdemannia flammicorona]
MLDRRRHQNLSAVFDQRTTKFLGEPVRLALVLRAGIDMVLHILHQRRIGAVHDVKTPSSNVTVDDSELAKDDVIEHCESILANPVPVRVIPPGFEGAENWLDTVRVDIAVLSEPQINISLKLQRNLLLFIVFLFTVVKIFVQVASVKVELLVDQLILLGFHSVELLAVDDGNRGTTSSTTSAGTRAECDASLPGVSLGNGIQPSLGFRFTAETSGGFHGETKKESTIHAATSKAVGVGQVGLGVRERETTRHLCTDHAGDQRTGMLAKRPRESVAKVCAELVQGSLLRLLRDGVVEFLLEVAEDLILQSRFTTDQIFDGLGSWDLFNGLLQLLSNDDQKNLGSRHRHVTENIYIYTRQTLNDHANPRNNKIKMRRQVQQMAKGRQQPRERRRWRQYWRLALMQRQQGLQSPLGPGDRWRTQIDTAIGQSVVIGLVFQAQSTLSHASQSRRRANLNEALDTKVLEQLILRLNPADRRGELVSQNFDQEGVAESLLQSRSRILVVRPPLEHLGETRAGSEIVHVIDVGLASAERLGGDVGDIFSSQLRDVHESRVDLLGEVSTEWRDTAEQEARVERHINALQRDSSVTTIQIDEATVFLLLSVSLREGTADDLAQLLLHLLEGHRLHKLLQINLGDLEHVGQSVQVGQFTSGDVLPILHVVVNDFQEAVALAGDGIDDIPKSTVVERLGDTARVDSDHTIVGSAKGIALDSGLHGHTAVEDNIDQGFNGQHIADGSQGGVLTKGVTSERAVLLDQSLGAHVFESRFLHQREGRLRELRGRQETAGGLEGVKSGALVDIGEQWHSFGRAVGFHHIVCHAHIVLADGITLRTAEVDRLLFGIVADDLQNGEAVLSQEMLVSLVPNLLGDRRAIVQSHAHTLFLGALTSEHVRCSGLIDLSDAVDNLDIILVDCLDLDDLTAVLHASVEQLGLQAISGKHHVKELDIVGDNPLGIIVGGKDLDELPRGSAGPHPMGDGARKLSQVREVGVDVNGIVVTRYLGVWFVRGRGGNGRRED